MADYTLSIATERPYQERVTASYVGEASEALRAISADARARLVTALSAVAADGGRA